MLPEKQSYAIGMQLDDVADWTLRSSWVRFAARCRPMSWLRKPSIAVQNFSSGSSHRTGEMLGSGCNWGLQTVVDSEEELRHRSLADRRLGSLGLMLAICVGCHGRSWLEGRLARMRAARGLRLLGRDGAGGRIGSSGCWKMLFSC
ncbi:hypothetical protein ACLOJK_012085 [Asimina triloba]